MTNGEDKEELYTYVKDYYWSTFRRNTAILSSTCRQLALGLGGLVWFAKPDIQNSCYSNSILLFIVLFFISDATQYLYQSYAFQKLAEEYDKKIGSGAISEKSKLTEKPNMNRLTNFFFIAKLIFLALATIFFLLLLFHG
jgi:hypothetical protein